MDNDAFKLFRGWIAAQEPGYTGRRQMEMMVVFALVM